MASMSSCGARRKAASYQSEKEFICTCVKRKLDAESVPNYIWHAMIVVKLLTYRKLVAAFESSRYSGRNAWGDKALPAPCIERLPGGGHDRRWEPRRYARVTFVLDTHGVGNFLAMCPRLKITNRRTPIELACGHWAEGSGFLRAHSASEQQHLPDRTSRLPGRYIHGT